MRFKRLILLCLLIVVLGSHRSQAQTIYGFRIGANVGSLSGVFADDAEPGSIIGLVAGSFVRLPLQHDLAVQAEVLYSQTGARFPAMELTLVERTLLATYLEIPLLIAYSPSLNAQVQPMLYVGGAIGFEIEEQIQERLEDFEQTQGSDVLISPDYRVVIGIDLHLPLGSLDALVGVRYTHGLRNLVNREIAIRSDAEVFTRAVALSVGFLF